MFSLIYGLWQYIFQKEELRILILGADLLAPTPRLIASAIPYMPPAPCGPVPGHLLSYYIVRRFSLGLLRPATLLCAA